MTREGTNMFRMKGFTLVEILVALTLFSLILAMIFTSLHSYGKTWEKSESQVAENDTSRLDLGFVRKQLGQAVPLVLLDGKSNPVLFKGEHDAVRFVSDLPGHRGGGGLYLMSLNINKHDDNKDLMLSYRPITTGIDLDSMDGRTDSDGKNITLLKHLDLLEFSYFGSNDDMTDPAWSDEWLEKQHLPKLVRMHMESVSANDYIPDIIVNLHTGNVRGQPQLILYSSEPGLNPASESTDAEGLSDAGSEAGQTR